MVSACREYSPWPTIKATSKSSLRLQATYALRNTRPTQSLTTRAQRDDPKKSPKVRLDMLLGKAANILCPIKLIVAMAMRTGALEDRTVEDVIGRAHSRPDRCVVWTPSRREDPLLPAFASRGNAISPKTPAPAKQLILSLQQASDLAGLLKQAKPHDLRRGAVRDVVHTPGITAIDVNLAAEVLSHTFEAKKNGISRSYVGHVKEPYFTKRVEEFADGDKAETFAMEFASSSFKRKVNTTAQIDAYCEENNLDPSNKNVRKQAGHRLSKKVRNDWVNAQMNPQASYPIIRESILRLHGSVLRANSSRCSCGLLIRRRPFA